MLCSTAIILLRSSGSHVGACTIAVFGGSATKDFKTEDLYMIGAEDVSLKLIYSTFPKEFHRKNMSSVGAPINFSISVYLVNESSTTYFVTRV